MIIIKIWIWKRKKNNEKRKLKCNAWIFYYYSQKYIFNLNWIIINKKPHIYWRDPILNLWSQFQYRLVFVDVSVII